MKYLSVKSLGLILLSTVLLGCADQWAEHIRPVDKNLETSLFQAIKAEQELSLFQAFLQETGYDAVLESTENYTVFAPLNTALSAYQSASVEVKKNLVKNHIAALSYNTADLNSMEYLMMLSGKRLRLDELSLNAKETVCSNGILRTSNSISLPKANLYELISAYKDSLEIARAIFLAGDSIMDPVKSIQTGVDPHSGRPIYDTAYLYYNPYLESLSIHQEDSSYCFVLLNNSNFADLKAKYAKYMQQWDESIRAVNDSLTDLVVTRELINDLICPTEGFEESAPTYLNTQGLSLDMNKALVMDRLEASNGLLLICDSVNIRMKDNKIKELYIQGEDYVETLNPAYTYVRLRDYAMGGKDVMVAGRWSESFDYVTVLDGVDTTLSKTVNYYYYSATASGSYYDKSINFYLKYTPTLYSTKYRLYWKTYDDFGRHFAGDTLDVLFNPEDPNQACPSVYRVTQKLYISLPGRPELKRNNGIIENLSLQSGAKVMVGITPDTTDASGRGHTIGVNAGVETEMPLRWYKAAGDYEALSTPLAAANTRDYLNCTSMGTACFYVTNSPYTSVSNSTSNGLIFLDYIRLVPEMIDEND